MLIDIDLFNPLGPEGEKYMPCRLQQGVYASTWMDREASVRKLEYPGPAFGEPLEKLIAWYNDTNQYVPAYGICDDVDQLLRKYPQVISSAEKYVLFVQLLRKADEPADGGIRFHKHGGYHGEKEVMGYEYLVHEPNLDEVYLFNIWRVTDQPNPSRYKNPIDR